MSCFAKSGLFLVIILFLGPRMCKAQEYKLYSAGYNYYDYPGYHIPQIGLGKVKGGSALYGAVMYTLPAPMLRTDFWSKLGVSANYTYRNNPLSSQLQPLLKLQVDLSYYLTSSPQIFWHPDSYPYWPFNRFHAHTAVGFGMSKHLVGNFFMEATLNRAILWDYKWLRHTSFLRGPVRNTMTNLFSIDLMYVLDFQPKPHSAVE